MVPTHTRETHMVEAHPGVRVGRIHGVSRTRPTRTRHNALAGHYAQQLLEVLSGHRVCDQLAVLTTEDVYDDVRTLVRRRLLRAPGDALPVLGRVHDASPAPGGLEVTATVGVGDRVELLAFRLERHSPPRRPETTTWRFTALETRW